MAKRGKHEGSITHRKDGRWHARLTLPGGRRKSYYAETRAEVARRLQVAQADLARGLPVVAEKQTVAAYLASWLEDAATRTEASTQRRYRDQVRLHLIPALGATILSRLEARAVQQLYTKKLQAGLAPATIRQMHAVLHQALFEAERLGLVQRNVSELVRLPPASESEQHPWNEDEANRFLEVVRGERLEALYILALSTGMRQGELLGLRWQDVDLARGKLQVRQALKEAAPVDGKRREAPGTPKTRGSRHTIAFSAALAVPALSTHKARQKAERFEAGEDYQPQDLVFCNELGAPLCRRTLVWQFKHLVSRAGVREIRFHDLRHTAATILLSRGVNVKQVSEMLGHSSIKMTLQIYGHVLPHMQAEAAKTMERVFARATASDLASEANEEAEEGAW